MTFLVGYAWLAGAIVIAATCTIVILRSVVVADDYEARPRRVLSIVLGGVAIVACLIMQFAPADRWLWVAALVPTYFAVQHGINTGIFKNPRFFDQKQEPDLGQLSDKRVVEAVRKKMLQERRLYSTPSLALRYLLPGIALMLAIVTVGYTMMSPPELKDYVLDERFTQGAQLGALGAYLYVVIYLGGRTMRGDTTPGALIWALATIVAGPTFAGAIQLIVISSPPKGIESTPWNDLLLPFAAGFSLRIVVGFVNGSIRRLLTDRVINSRGESLLRIRGITYDIEERLIEEGVEDVGMLADANPTRLHRNMRFDRRQIISWIDEALLMTFLPTTWQSFENDGVTGAIDLVWYVEHYGREAIIEAGAKGPDAMSSGAKAFSKLAERNKIDVAALAEVVLRMFTDGQVLLIWGLYQLEEGPSDGYGYGDFTPQLTEQDARAETPSVDESSSNLERFREKTYADSHKLFIAHSWKRSAAQGQVADITIKLVEHREIDGAPTNVRRVSYFMGRHFGNRVATSESAKDGYAITVSAYRPMLCIAKVELANVVEPVMLYRYIDFDIPTPKPEPSSTPRP